MSINPKGMTLESNEHMHRTNNSWSVIVFWARAASFWPFPLTAPKFSEMYYIYTKCLDRQA